jgi:hypothetical protein
MRDFKIFAGLVIAATIIWHVAVAFSADKKITGLFKVKPVTGYGWEKLDVNIGGLGCTYKIDKIKKMPKVATVIPRSPASRIGLLPDHYITKINGVSTQGMSKKEIGNKLMGSPGTFCSITFKYDPLSLLQIGFNYERTQMFMRDRISAIDDNIRLENAYDPKARYFWQKTAVKWCPGFLHPEQKVYATQTKDSWDPLPGYVFENKKKSLATEWTPELKHPSMNAWSATEEGKWAAGLGYEFVMEDGLAVNTIWTPLKSFYDLKITTSTIEGRFNSFAGYTFINPEKSLAVRWTPGMSDPFDHPNQVAGRIEGQWVAIDEYNSSIWKAHFVKSATAALTATIVRGLIGRGMLVTQLMRISGEELINGVMEMNK